MVTTAPDCEQTVQFRHALGTLCKITFAAASILKGRDEVFRDFPSSFGQIPA
jgi:hypothetical protein